MRYDKDRMKQQYLFLDRQKLVIKQDFFNIMIVLFSENLYFRPCNKNTEPLENFHVIKFPKMSYSVSRVFTSLNYFCPTTDLIFNKKQPKVYIRIAHNIIQMGYMWKYFIIFSIVLNGSK